MKKRKWFDFKEYLSKKAVEIGALTTATFEITGRCNLHCKMCYVRQDDAVKGQEKTAQEWIDLAKEARDCGVLYILLTGGEVFLRNDFQKIYTGICDLGIIPTIYTNGTLIDEQTVGWLKRMPPEKISITLYGASPETYSKVCRNSTGYYRAIKGIDLLLDNGFNVELKTTIVPDNALDYEKLMAFVSERAQILKFCSYISPPRNASTPTNEIWRLDPDSLANYLFIASRDYRKRVNAKTPENEKEKELKNGVKNGIIESSFKCSAGQNDPWITWDGLMIPCGLMDEPKTMPFTDGFQSAWDTLKTKVKEIPFCAECKNCELKENCLTCPARLIGEVGRYDKSAQYLCELAKKQNVLYSKTIV